MIGYDSDKAAWTVTWDDQDVTWEGWKGTVYVKAKENFLGGNTINTNLGKASAVAESYTVTGTDSAGNPISSTVDLSDMELSKRSYSMDTPYVNVNELALTQHSTEWTVYLGTEVNPKEQLEKLLTNVDIRKVVSADTNEMITDKSQMLGGTSDQSKTMNLLDYLGVTAPTQVSGLISSLIAGNTITYQYNSSNSAFASAYGHGYVGDITIALTEKEGCYNKENHETEAVGTDTKYTLKVEYVPRDVDTREAEIIAKLNESLPEDEQLTELDYHTTAEGSAGDPTGNMTSANTHIINVIDRKIQITKVDAEGNPIKTESAEFELYRADENGSAVTGLPDGKYVQIGSTLTTDTSSGSTPEAVLEKPTKNTDDSAVKNYESSQKTFKKYYIDETQYYVLETNAPTNYVKLDEPVSVKLGMTETKTPVLTDSSGNVILYSWTQTPTVTVDTTNTYVTADASGNPIKISIRNDQITNLEIIKTDDASTPKTIGGAVFKLIKDNIVQTNLKIVSKKDQSTVSVDALTGEFTVPEDGVVIQELAGGEYTLIEVSPPVGYLKTIQNIVFSIDGMGNITDTANALNDGKVEFASETKTYTVQNETGAELPHTGGPGTRMIYLAGFILTLLAAAGVVCRKKNSAA